VVDELSDLHQHERVHVVRDVEVPVDDRRHETGTGQRVAAAGHTGYRDRYATQ